MPNPTQSRRPSTRALTVIALLVLVSVTANVLLPRVLAAVEKSKAAQRNIERLRKIAEAKLRRPGDAKEKGTAKRELRQPAASIAGIAGISGTASTASTASTTGNAEAAERLQQARSSSVDLPAFKLPKPDGEEREDGFDKPREAAAYFNKKRLPVGQKELPIEEYFTAWRHAQTLPQFSTTLNRFLADEESKFLRSNKEGAEAKAAGWTPLGPGNIGGRTRAILINPQDPNIMYSAGVSGGIWKSTNAGAAWTPVADLIANITVSTMAFEPGNPSVIYAGTGEGVYGFEYDGDLSSGDFRGAGIFKSADAGATWTRVTGTDTQDFYYVNKIVVSSNDKNRIYAATRSGVMRTLDGGATWTRTHNPIGPRGGTINAGCLDLAIRTDKTMDVVFAACGNFEQATVYRNADAALATSTWDSVLTAAGMGRTALAIAPSNQDIIYAVSSSVENTAFNSSLFAVFRSTAGGASGSWTAQVRNTTNNKLNRAILSLVPFAIATDCGFDTEDGYLGQGWYDLTIAVDPVDSNRVWVGGIEFFRSDDGGVNWGLAGPGYDFATATGISLIHPDQHTIVFHPKYDGTANQTIYIGNDGGLFRSDNSRAATLTTPAAACKPSTVGVKWTALNNNYGVTQFYHGTVSADGKTYVGGTQDNGTILGTDDKGANAWRIVNGGDGGFTAIDQSNPSILFGSFPGIAFRKSTDSGDTFGAATFGINDEGLFVTPFVMDPSDSQRMWTGGYYLWRTPNGGSRWERGSALTAGEEYVSSIAIAPTDSNRVLIGMGDGYVLRNSSALTGTPTTTWADVRIRAGFVSSLAFDPNNKDIAYATFSNFGGSHVYRTADGGVNWTPIDRAGSANGLPNIPVHSIAIDPSNTMRLYVGTDIGVFVTSDGGQNWAAENTGFANVITEQLQIQIANGTTWLYAFTHGRGVWRTMVNNTGCSYALSPATRTLGAAAVTGTINVKAAPGACAWTAASNASWLRVTGGGSGDGTVNFSADANTSFASRAATATIAGRSFTVIQSGQTDADAPLVAITSPTLPQPAPNVSGVVTLAGTATDNNAVASITWLSNRGASGTATYTASTGRWTATNVPLSPGQNTITVTARDATGNVARAVITLGAAPPAILVTIAGNGVTGTTGDGGPAAAARISRPIRLDIDGAGNIYFTDSDNHTIRKITPAGIISTIAGSPGSSGFSGDGGAATAARLNFPIGVAVDGAGNVYICDSGNNRIRKVTAATGVISTIAGNGTAGFSGDGAAGTSAQINTPQNVAVDKNGNVYISDFSNNRIRKVNAADGVISTVAGAGTLCSPAGGTCGDGGAATAAFLNGPNNVSVDKDGNLIVSDPGNFRIRKVTVADGKIATIVGTGVQGFSGDGGPALSAQVSVPVGAITDSVGNLYFSDRGNQRVRRVDATTNIISTIAGTGVSGFNGEGLAPLSSTLNFPTGLALNPTGNLYIGDRDNGRIRRLLTAVSGDVAPPTVVIAQPTDAPTFTTTNGALNLSGTATDNNVIFQVRWSNDRGGSGVAAGTTSWTVSNIPLQSGPNNLTVTAWDVNGNAASARLLVNFNPEQLIQTLAGSGTAGDGGDGGAAVGARLFFPSAVAADAMGNVYIADTDNHRVRRVTPGGIIQPFAGNGFVGSSGDGGQALNATMNEPQGLAIDAAGNVYISDTGNNRIRRVSPSGIITTVAGTGVDSFSGDGGPATQAQLSSPFQITLDAAGNLYIADNGNRRIRKVNAADGVISTIAGDGRIGNEGNGGPAVNAQFLYPTGVAVDRNGVVYVLDSYDNRVRRIGTDGRISNYVGTGNFGYSGDGGPATAAELDPLSYIALDTDNNLYIADYFNHAIRKVTAATGIITTVVGTGAGGFSGDGASPRSAQLAFPNDLTFDRAGNMYIADLGNQRVRRVFNAGGLKTVSAVSAASFMGDSLSSELIAAAFGMNLATATQSASSTPLPNLLGGTTVRVRDALGTERLAPLFMTAPGQINFLIPQGTANGAATITVTNSDGAASSGVAQITSVAPGLFAANADGQGVASAVVFRIRANGQQVFEPVSRIDSATNKAVAVPIDLGPEGDQVFLIAYGTGWRFRNSLETSSATIGGANAELVFLGAQGGFAGLDQANLRLPRTLAGKGDVEVKLTVDGKASNTVRINVK
ncbi:MAG TPA: BACON domain-containing carbohydrate-binding protein [Blastocatellia bacterium]|nr:BACON domain-containing carbohydrate-binding protein [Blastocatellia bacterium]